MVYKYTQIGNRTVKSKGHCLSNSEIYQTKFYPFKKKVFSHPDKDYKWPKDRKNSVSVPTTP